MSFDLIESSQSLYLHKPELAVLFCGSPITINGVSTCEDMK